MVQEPTSYIYLGVDDLLKNGRSQDSIYILEPSNTRLFFNKHQKRTFNLHAMGGIERKYCKCATVAKGNMQGVRNLFFLFKMSLRNFKLSVS